MAFTSYEVDNDRIFQEALDRSIRGVRDLRDPLRRIANDFYKSQQAIFLLQSSGLYPPLSPKYAEAKKRAVGFAIPILRRLGVLEESVTKPKGKGAINTIRNKNTLTLGTKVPYALFHQLGAPKINLPIRKMLFIGPEAPRFAKGRLSGRAERWLNTINGHVLAVMKAQGFDVPGFRGAPGGGFVGG